MGGASINWGNSSTFCRRSDWDLGEFGGFDNAHIVDFLKPFLIKYISVQGCNVLLGGREQNPGCPSRTFHYNETVNSICDSCQGF